MKGIFRMLPWILSMATLLFLIWFCFPSWNYPDADSDMNRLRMSVGADVVRDCLIDVERRDFRNRYDSDEDSAMSHAEIGTMISWKCGQERVNANIYTYKTRISAWWQSRGMSQCGENYCQRAWVHDRQMLVINGPLPELGLTGPWLSPVSPPEI